ncbi:MAG TPA: hypothetical protein VK789_09550 [Bryobacteraceae bacterium]|nr:hypothetical protein [Bryobacteraceae bacterium]
MNINQRPHSIWLVAASLCLSAGVASAQENVPQVSIKPADIAAGRSATRGAEHALGLPDVDRVALWAAGRPLTATSSVLSSTHSLPSFGFFPADLEDTSNGATVASAQSHGLYVNCLPACWGTPSNFLNDLSKSDFIHVVDNYTSAYASDRYTVGEGVLLSGALPHTLDDADILGIVHAGAAAIGGTGYHHVYHVFLPQGTDVCFTGTSICYSPDNKPTWVFCAYHASADFTDIGHVLLTVEPYQNVNGCAVAQPSPNGPLVDSTADVLSHELIETITDPDGTAWWNNVSLPLFGAEIGDECQNATFNYGSVTINHRNYEIQPEYSNTFHGCVFSPYLPPLPF